MKQCFYFLIFMVLSLNSPAQNFPLNAKFIISYPPNPALNDTVWFGCDTAGGVGYQMGLDIIDTTFADSIGILGYDSQLATDSGIIHCGNLKRDIKAFETGVVSFYFYLNLDSLFATWIDWGQPILLKWDTNDFKYNGEIFQNDSFKITSIRLESFNGYLEAFDGYSHTIYNGFDTIALSPPFYFYSSEVPVFFEQPLWGCYSNNDMMQIELKIAFNHYRSSIGIHENNPEDFSFSLFPNPNNGSFQIQMNRYFMGDVMLFNLSGQQVYNEYLINSDSKAITLNGIPPGIYFLNFTDSNTGKSYYQKIIINQ